MEITEVRIKLMEDNSGSNERLQAFCSITFDDMFVIRDLKIIEGAKGFFVAMPSVWPGSGASSTPRWGREGGDSHRGVARGSASGPPVTPLRERHRRSRPGAPGPSRSGDRAFRTASHAGRSRTARAEPAASAVGVKLGWRAEAGRGRAFGAA